METIIDAEIPGKKLDDGSLNIWRMKLIRYRYGIHVNAMGDEIYIKVVEYKKRKPLSEIWIGRVDHETEAVSIFIANLIEAWKRGLQQTAYKPDRNLSLEEQGG